MKRAITSLPRACGALAALALALPLAARAEVRGSVHLLDFSWSVVDLDPNDGIAASVTMGPDFVSTLRAGVVTRGVDGQGDPLPFGPSLSREWMGNLPFANAHRDLALPGAQASARMGGDATAGSYGFLMDGQATRAADPAQAYSGFTAGGSVYGNVVLGPYSELVLTGRVSLSVEKTGSGAGLRHERVESRFGVFMENEELIDWVDYGLALDTYGRAPGRLAREETFRLTFSNLNTFEAPSSFHVGMGLEGYSSMTPVPEPGAVGLMLAGVGVVGFVARRRAPQGFSVAARQRGNTC